MPNFLDSAGNSALPQFDNPESTDDAKECSCIPGFNFDPGGLFEIGSGIDPVAEHISIMAIQIYTRKDISAKGAVEAAWAIWKQTNSLINEEMEKDFAGVEEALKKAFGDESDTPDLN